MQNYKEEFYDIFNSCVKRQGKDKFLEWLSGTDFFTAPASTKFHGACECGLVMHSLNVYRVLKSRNDSLPEEERYSDESIAIVALCHDICKANFYKQSLRNVKNDETGVWEKVPIFQVADAFPFGHGEKSVFLINWFMRLSVEEAMAIRWHMGGFDDSAKAGGYAMSEAFRMYPLAVMTHLADLEATYLLEKGTSKVNNK